MSDKPVFMELEDTQRNRITDLADHEEGKVQASSTGHETLREPISKWTSAGVTLESFKRRDYGSGIAEFNRPMKPRHVQMIAIGGSIGSGFFVGSGAALHKGVRDHLTYSVASVYLVEINRETIGSRVPLG